MVKMLGFRPWSLIYFVWIYVAPFYLMAIIVFSFVESEELTYAGKKFPWYGQLIGHLISFSSIIMIPLYFVYYLLFKTDSKLSWKQVSLRNLGEDEELISLFFIAIHLWLPIGRHCSRC